MDAASRVLDGAGPTSPAVEPRVLVVDAWPGFAQALASLLTRAGLPAQHASLAEASQTIQRRQPAVLLLDGDGGTRDAVALARTARHANKTVRLLLLSSASGAQLEALTAATAADVVLSRDLPLHRVVEATRRALTQGGAAWRRRGRAGVTPAHREGPDSVGTQALSQREQDVLLGMSAGMSNAGIAADLEISPHTVRTHVQRILGKLGAGHRLEAVAVARRLGLFVSQPSVTTEQTDAVS